MNVSVELLLLGEVVRLGGDSQEKEVAELGHHLKAEEFVELRHDLQLNVEAEELVETHSVKHLTLVDKMYFSYVHCPYTSVWIPCKIEYASHL